MGRPLQPPNLTEEEREFIEQRYPSVVLDEFGWFISKKGKRTSGRLLLRRFPTTVAEREEMGVRHRTRNTLKWNTYLENIAKGCRQSVALRAANLTQSALSSRRKVDPEFVEAEKLAIIGSTEPIVDAMFTSALNGNFQAQNKILEHLDPETWKQDKTIRIEQTSTAQIDAGAVVGRIQELLARLEERKMLTQGFIDAEVVDDSEDELD